MGITTTIPTNLNFPNRGVLERDDFVNAQETAQDLLAGAYTAALNQYATELNDTEEDINLKWEQVQNQAVVGSYSQAYIDANFTNKAINSLTAKTTPIDADLFYLGDSASSFGLKKLSWANLKTILFGSPALTGTPTAPTPTTGDNSTKVATTAFATGQDIGVGQTLQNVTASRVAGTTYTNSTGKPIFISCECTVTGTSLQATLQIDGLEAQAYIIAGFTNNSVRQSVCGVIPNGSTYKVVTTGAILVWNELR